MFKGLTSGQEVVNYVNGVEVPSCFLWEGTELLIESWMKIGECKSSFRDYWSLSSDGSTLTMEHCADELAGLITILEKNYLRTRIIAQSKQGNIQIPQLTNPLALCFLLCG